MKYEKALEELEAIAEKLESGECDIDELSKNLRRAKELVKLCNDKLRQADDEVRAVIGEAKEDN